jgi:hypothetical protein
MTARSLPMGILVAACLVALAAVSWAGAGRVKGYPWTGTGNHHGRQGQQRWQGSGNREGWLNQRDRGPWRGNPPHGSRDDDRDDRGRQARFQPPWGGPLHEGGPVRW